MDAQTKLLQGIYAELQSIHSELTKLGTLAKNLTQCSRCRGKGSVLTPLGPDECPACQGTGTKP